ncbi:hypothetical protein THAOC_01590 [Thalassiosira oceanica]|uniref:Uncharacterized protein n=1 Tax=Thalassiosira oceanica TaxID=159749 RepID=K0TQU1_THAOC|nr:hypothetical protein THAOC_01590 [Thalassiosira oceanica]|eukprot:EJK76637.1 hypothetical protein THAOC_01590 [Thalassiosira oceanica]
MRLEYLGRDMDFATISKLLRSRSKESKEQYVNSKVERAGALRCRALAEIAKTHPQSAHAAFTFCSPAQVDVYVMSGYPWHCAAAGTAGECHTRGEKLDMLAHERQMKETRKSEIYVRAMDEESLVFQLGQRKPSLKNRLVRASNSGTWLSAIPNHLCDNILSAVEFRDNIRLRYGLVPLNLEPICDGCGKRADVEHYLSCPVGGLRNIRHDELGRTFATHAKDALSKAYVRREPRTIPSGEQRQYRNSNAAGANATSPQTQRREDRRAFLFLSVPFRDTLDI